MSVGSRLDSDLRRPWILGSALRLNACLLLVLTVPTVIPAYIVLSSVYEQQRELHLNRERFEVTEQSQHAESRLELSRAAVQWATENTLVLTAIGDNDRLSLDHFLCDAVGNLQALHSAVIVDWSGRMLASVGPTAGDERENYAGEAWFQDSIGAGSQAVVRVAEAAAPTTSENRTIVVSQGIADPSGEIVGAMAVELDAAGFVRDVLSELRAGVGGDFVVTPDGRMYTEIPGASPAAGVLSKDFLERIVKSGTSAFVAPNPMNGEASLMVSAPISSLGWRIISSHPLAGVFGPLNRVIGFVLFVFALGFLVMAVVGYFCVRAIGAHQKLEEDFRRSAEQARVDLTTAVKVRTAELVEANNAFEAAQRRHLALISTMTSAIWTSNAEGCFEDSNGAWKNYTGQSSPESMGDGWVESLHPDDRDRIAAAWKNAVTCGGPFEAEARVWSATSKDYRYCQFRAVPLHDGAGQVKEWIGRVRDVDDKRRAEGAAAAIEFERHEFIERMRAVLSRMPLGCIICDADMRITYWNPAATRIFGYCAEEATGRAPHELITLPAARATVEQILTRLAAGEAEIDGIGENITKDGRRIICEWITTPLARSDGSVVGSLCVCQDVTARHAAEKKLRESEERYGLVIRGTSDGIWDWNIETNEVFYSPRCVEMLGYHPGADLGRDFNAFVRRVHPDDRDAVMSKVDGHLHRNGPFETRYRLMGSDGTYRWFEARGQAVWDERGRPTRMAGAIREASESSAAAGDKNGPRARAVASTT